MMNAPIIDGLQCGRYTPALLDELRSQEVAAVTITAAFWEDSLETMDRLAAWNDLIREHSDLALIVRTAEDIETAARTDRVGIVLGAQNSSLFNDRIGFIEHFWHLGVRVVQLTYNNQNAIGSSCYEPHDSGLSRFGHEAVDEMNRVGMLIDLSHVGDRTAAEAIAASRRPVAINHANAKSVFEHPRNKDRATLEALVANDGVLGVCTYNNISGEYAGSLDGAADLIARHVDLLGVRHVAFGSDLDPGAPAGDLEWMRKGRWTRRTQTGASRPDLPEPPAEWMDDFAKFGAVRSRLIERGLLSESDAHAVFHGNWLRLYRDGFQPEGGSHA